MRHAVTFLGFVNEVLPDQYRATCLLEAYCGDHTKRDTPHIEMFKTRQDAVSWIADEARRRGCSIRTRRANASGVRRSGSRLPNVRVWRGVRRHRRVQTVFR